MSVLEIHRIIDVCSDCPNFLNAEKIFGKRREYEHNKYFCKTEDAIVDENGKLVQVINHNCTMLIFWNRKVVTKKCDKYAEYFIRELENEQES